MYDYMQGSSNNINWDVDNFMPFKYNLNLICDWSKINRWAFKQMSIEYKSFYPYKVRISYLLTGTPAYGAGIAK